MASVTEVDRSLSSSSSAPTSPSYEEQSMSTLSKDAHARIEVALYASGRPLGLDEISKVARVVSKK